MAEVPAGYIPVAEAGRGVTSCVYYCLPKRTVDMVTVGRPLTPSTIGFTGLKRSIVAIKVSPAKLLIEREVLALHAIQKCIAISDPTLTQHFLSPRATGSFRPDGKLAYIVLPAITPPLTLTTLLTTCAAPGLDIPVLFVYHIFLSLVPAVLFLRDEAQWAHNDIKADNILCRLSADSPSNLPDIVLVDFAMGYPISTFKNDSGDCKNVLSLVRQFSLSAEANAGDKLWKRFRRMLDGELMRDRWQVDAEMAGIWSAWKGEALEARDRREGWEVRRIAILLETAVEGMEVTNEMLVQACAE